MNNEDLICIFIQSLKSCSLLLEIACFCCWSETPHPLNVDARIISSQGWMFFFFFLLVSQIPMKFGELLPIFGDPSCQKLPLSHVKLTQPMQSVCSLHMFCWTIEGEKGFSFWRTGQIFSMLPKKEVQYGEYWNLVQDCSSVSFLPRPPPPPPNKPAWVEGAWGLVEFWNSVIILWLTGPRILCLYIRYM